MREGEGGRQQGRVSERETDTETETERVRDSDVRRLKYPIFFRYFYEKMFNESSMQSITSVHHISLPYPPTCIFPPYEERPKTNPKKFFSFQISHCKSFPNDNFSETKLFYVCRCFRFNFP